MQRAGFLPIPRHQYANDDWTGEKRFALNVFHELVARAAIYDSRTLYRGQFLASRASIARRCGITDWMARRALVLLAEEGMIRPASGQPASGRSLVWEVVDFDDYCHTVDRPFQPPEEIPGKPCKATATRCGTSRSPGFCGPSSWPSSFPPAQTIDITWNYQDSSRFPSRSPSRSEAPLPHIESKEGEEPTTTTRARADRPVEVVVGSLSAPQGEDPARELATPREVPAAFGPCQEDELVKGLIRLWNATRDEIQREVPLDSLERKGGLWTAIYAAWRRRPDWEHWAEVFELCATTPFCLGEGEKRWVAHLLWVVRKAKPGEPSNPEKLIAGQFGIANVRNQEATSKPYVPYTYEQHLADREAENLKRREALRLAAAEKKANEPQPATRRDANVHNPGRPRIVLDPREVFGADYRASQPQAGLYP